MCVGAWGKEGRGRGGECDGCPDRTHTRPGRLGTSHPGHLAACCPQARALVPSGGAFSILWGFLCFKNSPVAHAALLGVPRSFSPKKKKKEPKCGPKLGIRGIGRERSSLESKATVLCLCSHPAQPGDSASWLGTRAHLCVCEYLGFLWVCVCACVCFSFVLFFWENKSPFCGTWASQRRKRENQLGQEENVASRGKVSLLCAFHYDWRLWGAWSGPHGRPGPRKRRNPSRLQGGLEESPQPPSQRSAPAPRQGSKQPAPVGWTSERSRILRKLDSWPWRP